MGKSLFLIQIYRWQKQKRKEKPGAGQGENKVPKKNKDQGKKDGKWAGRK
jgi:hypothetical protein